MSRDRAAEKPFRDGTQSQVHLQTCKEVEGEKLSVFAAKPCSKGKKVLFLGSTGSSRSLPPLLTVTVVIAGQQLAQVGLH